MGRRFHKDDIEARWQARPRSLSRHGKRLDVLQRLGRKSRIRVILDVLVKAAVLFGFAALCWWLVSTRRHEEISIRRISCSTLPWYYFARETEPLYSREDLYLPARTTGNYAGRPSIGILQTCSKARRWPFLDQLVQNHRSHAAKYGYEYDMKTDGTRGVWDKILLLIDRIRTELDKPEASRQRWFFYTDVDTLVLNDEMRLEAMLPPAQVSVPFLLITKDHRALNAGTFFLKVDPRSVTFLLSIMKLSASKRKLPFAEQSAIALVAEEANLEATGQMVFIPASWINFYAIKQQLPPDTAIFQLHWPSLGFKRRDLLPTLRKLRSGIPLASQRYLARSAERLRAEASDFWAGHSEG